MSSNLFLSNTFNCFLISVLVILSHNVFAYNLDVNSAKVFNISKNSNTERGNYFGYSVALYANGKDSVLLVGAPRANSSVTRKVIEPGVVYHCPINDTCKEWIIDDAGNNWHRRKSVLNQIKDNAWIGATIAVENATDSKVVFCGPRWINSIQNENKINWLMNGICYWAIASNAESFNKKVVEKLLPFLDLPQIISIKNGAGIYYFGMSQLGFSLHITSNELRRDLILGSPGTYNWKGTTVLNTDLLVGKSQTIVPSLKDEARIRDYDYVGYTVTSGCYFEKGKLWYATGAPRAENMFGNVIIHKLPAQSNKKLIMQKIVSGDQHGEYFGAALASCDVNGNGNDELIVGAPQWTKDMDEGRVYIFATTYKEVFEKQVIDGEKLGSRFGSVVTCLGDIDYDGFADVAVGAPYGEQTGAVYIFNGNSNGLTKRYSQKIIGKQFGENIRGFGISISDPRDVNDDKYPDIAIGAYLSEHAVLLKSKPVVTLTTKLAYIEKKKLLKNSTFFFINVCTSYSGIYAPKNLQIVTFLKIDQTYGRAFYDSEKKIDNIQSVANLYASEISCNDIQIQLKKNIQNLINPLEISISVALEKDLQSEKEKRSLDFFCASCAIVNKFHSKTEDVIKLPFAVECGEDDVCVSDIRITLSTDLKSDNRFIIGSRPTVKFIINAINYGEPAYQARIHVYAPEILSLASIPPACMESSRINNIFEVICDVGNPLKENKTLSLELDMSKIRFNTHQVSLWTKFTTQSEEKNSLHGTQDLNIYFDADADIAIAGKARDDLYSYFLRHENEEKQLSSLRFQHVYEVQKFGASPIEEVTLGISIPTYWKDSAGDIEIININETVGYMDGQPFYCTSLNFTDPTFLIDESKNRHTHKLNTQEKYSVESNFSLSLPPENRAIYINCSNTGVKCTHIKCELGPFVRSSSVAKLSFTLDIYLSNFKPKMLEGRDIIYFVSNGSVIIPPQCNITQKLEHKPDTAIVATMFLGSPITERLASWIIAVSVVSGIVLLILLVLGLIRIGFFNRKQKEELEALKSKANKDSGITIETNSSREILDQE